MGRGAAYRRWSVQVRKECRDEAVEASRWKTVEMGGERCGGIDRWFIDREAYAVLDWARQGWAWAGDERENQMDVEMREDLGGASWFDRKGSDSKLGIDDKRSRPQPHRDRQRAGLIINGWLRVDDQWGRDRCRAYPVPS